MATNGKAMKPIRTQELEHIRLTISRKFEGRKSELESQMENEIQERTEKNIKPFKVGLKIKAKEDQVIKAQADLDNFLSTKESVEKRLMEKLKLAQESFFNHLDSWRKTRNWRDFDFESGTSCTQYPNKFFYLCKEETARHYKRSPEGKALRDLERFKEQAQNYLYSGRSITQVWAGINGIFKQAEIQAEIPQEMLQITEE